MKKWIILAALLGLHGILITGCHTDDDRPTATKTEAAVVQEKPAEAPTAEMAPATRPTPPAKHPEDVSTAPTAAGRSEPQEAPVFAAAAFPPTIPDTAWHQDAWRRNDCLRCHETGVEEAPMIRHEGMPEILKTAVCRSCHILVPGTEPRQRKQEGGGEFAANAFPPMIPASRSHRRAWTRDDCLLCHKRGIGGAPRIVHEGLPALTFMAKCRTCHVQVRAIEASHGSGR